MNKLIKAIYVHLITKPKYNRLENYYQAEIKVREERTRERDEQIKINTILKKKFEEELNKLLEENINLKMENKELKKKKKCGDKK